MKAETSETSAIDLSNTKLNPKHLLLFLFGLSLTIGSRLFELTKYGLWMDEVFSLHIARLDWSALFQQAIYDAVHPPLFYIVLKMWAFAGGESLLWLKLLPFAFALGAIGPLYLLCRQLAVGFREFSLALIFISLNSYLIYYSQELRMYSLLLFLSLVSMWLFIKFLRDESDAKLPLIFLFAVNLLVVYTQYFGWMTVLTECIVVLLYDRQKLKAILAQTLAVGLCFLPWCFLVVSAMADKGGFSQNLGWIDKPGFSAVALFVAELNGNPSLRFTTTLGLLIFTPPIIIWVSHIYKNRNRNCGILFTFLALTAMLPVLLAFAVSNLLQISIFVDRYFIAAAVPYMLLVAVSVSRIKSAWLRRVFALMMICWSLGVGVWNLTNHRTRVDWASVSNRIADRNRLDEKNEEVYVFEQWAAMPLEQELSGSPDAQPILRVGKIDEINDDKFWLAYRQTAWKDVKTSQQQLLEKQCNIKDHLTDEPDRETVHLLLVECKK